MHRTRYRLESLAIKWGKKQGLTDHVYRSIFDQVASLILNLLLIAVAVAMQITEHTIGWDIFSILFATLGGVGLKCSHIQYCKYTKFMKYIKTKGCS